jgi:hypothetical protein
VEIAQASQLLLSDRPADQPRGPAVARIILGTQLCRLRQARGVTAETAAHAIRASHTKISRMERGRGAFTAREVADLLTLYGVTDHGQRGRLLGWLDRPTQPTGPITTAICCPAGVRPTWAWNRPAR